MAALSNPMTAQGTFDIEIGRTGYYMIEIEGTWNGADATLKSPGGTTYGEINAAAADLLACLLLRKGTNQLVIGTADPTSLNCWVSAVVQPVG